MLAFFLVSLAVWLSIAPLLGLIAFAKTNTLERQNAGLRAEINALRANRSNPKGPLAPPPAPRPAPVAAPDREPAAPLSREPAPSPSPTPSPAPSRDEIDVGDAIRAVEPPIDPPVEPPTQSASDRPAPRPPVNWERVIAANWIVWAGGLALALGALFLVRATVEAGLFGPRARTLAAALLGIGLIAGAFWVRRRPVLFAGRDALRHLPSILAGAGLIALYGVGLAAGVLYNLAPPITILAGFALTSALALALAVLYGRALAAIGLSGAYAAPFFTGAEGGSALLMLPYAAIVTATGLALISWRGWRFLSWLTFVGAMVWGFVALLGASESQAAWATPAYVVSLLVLALAFSEQIARTPMRTPDTLSAAVGTLRERGEPLATAYLFWLGGGALLGASLLQWRVEPYALGALAAYAGLGFAAAARRDGFALLAPLSTVLVFTVLALWPEWSADHTRLCLGIAAGVGGAGFALYRFWSAATPIAATSALAPPVGLFIAFWRGGGLEPSLLWGFIAFGAAAAMLGLLDVMRRAKGGLDARPGAAASYALGASLCIALAPFLTLSGVWLGPAVVVAAACLALTHARFALELLRYAGVALAGLGTALLVNPLQLAQISISSTPVFNELTWTFGLSIAALTGGGWLLRGHPNHARGYQGMAAFAAFVLVGLLIRHAAGSGRLDGPPGGYAEASGYAIAYLGAAAGLAWRRRDRGWIGVTAEYCAALFGVSAIIAALNAVNWDAALGAPVFNLLLLAFALPAILLGVYAIAHRRAGRLDVAEIAGFAAMASGLAWVTAETRRAFAGPDLMANGLTPTSAGEMWGYSTVWLVFALCLLGWGVWRTVASVRYASLGLMCAVLLKVFLVDLSALDGVWRAASFIGLGATLLAVAVFYQRFVFARGLTDKA